tara:strand:- start:105 stop:362 length:258 start_codon:yes stop_codon:yes gene_type:complete
MSNILIYTKNYCAFCIRAKSLLEMKKIKFNEINLNEFPDKLDGMLTQSNGARTVPQIFNGDQHIGDCEKIYQLNTEGKLDELLGI